MPRVLIVDDESSFRYGLNIYLKKQGIEVLEAENLARARELLLDNPDIVLLDINLPDGKGTSLLPEIKKEHPSCAVVVITGKGDIPTAVEAMKLGADHFMEKPFAPQDLNAFLFRGEEIHELKRHKVARDRLLAYKEPEFGKSSIIREVLRMAKLASPSDSPILIRGETGTGKGVLSRWIHEHSPRRNHAFVEVNCAALKGELLQSELFGHVRGAFTSAVQDRSGLLEIAHNGTLFLDEIGDMGLEVQAMLLKVIEEKRFRRLGDSRQRLSNFRLITATHRNLEELVKQGKFREDLWYRIQVFEILLPPLRERMEDLPHLATAILQDLGRGDCELSPSALDLLKGYTFPGNIRELRNLLERAVILAGEGRILEPRHFPSLLSSAPSSPSPSEATGSFDLAPLEEIELRMIEKTLERFGGKIERAAKALGISRSTLYRKLKKKNLSSSTSLKGAPTPEKEEGE
jgi:DNA-binding NtrC family response regulator